MFLYVVRSHGKTENIENPRPKKKVCLIFKIIILETYTILLSVCIKLFL